MNRQMDMVILATRLLTMIGERPTRNRVANFGLAPRWMRRSHFGRWTAVRDAIRAGKLTLSADNRVSVA